MGLWKGLSAGFPTARYPSNRNARSLLLPPLEPGFSLFHTVRLQIRLDPGAYPALCYTFLLSLASIIFIGSASTKGPKGAYTVPDASGIKSVFIDFCKLSSSTDGRKWVGWCCLLDRMGLFTVVLTLISLPATVIINR